MQLVYTERPKAWVSKGKCIKYFYLPTLRKRYFYFKEKNNILYNFSGLIPLQYKHNSKTLDCFLLLSLTLALIYLGKSFIRTKNNN